MRYGNGVAHRTRTRPVPQRWGGQRYDGPRAQRTPPRFEGSDNNSANGRKCEMHQPLEGQAALLPFEVRLEMRVASSGGWFGGSW